MNKKRDDGKMSRSAFIRSQPKAATADEVVAAAKKEGYDVSRDMVHKVRWQVKTHEKIHGKPRKSAKKAAPKKVAKIVRAQGGELEGLVARAAFATAFDEARSLICELVRGEVRQEMQRIMLGNVQKH
jgi:hypothetical protein